MKSFIEQFELTEFSNNNFAIIGRILYIATQYEKTFRAYFNGLACKYLPCFVKEIDEFSRIELTNDFMANMNEVLNTSSKLSFHRIISIFFEKIINKAIPSNQIKDLFISAKETRNYIAHKLCNFPVEEAEVDSFKNFFQNELEEKLKQLIECTLIMENCINEFNKDPLLKNISKEVDRIFAWTINPLN